MSVLSRVRSQLFDRTAHHGRVIIMWTRYNLIDAARDQGFDITMQHPDGRMGRGLGPAVSDRSRPWSALLHASPHHRRAVREHRSARPAWAEVLEGKLRTELKLDEENRSLIW